MSKSKKEESEDTKTNGSVLPKALNRYEKADFAIQQKAKFIYYMIITVLAGLILLLTTSTFLQLIRTENSELYLPALLPIIALVFLIVGCLVLLIKGFYGLSTHLLMILSILTVWLVMWFDRGHFFARLDTVVIVVALLNLSPLFITRFKSTILIYIFASIAMLILFMWVWGDAMELPFSVTLDFIIDTSVALLFTGFVGYNIFAINKKTVDRAQIEINERKQTEESLKESDLFRKRVFDSSRISIVIMDAITLEYIDCNQAAVDIYRFQSREFALGKTPLDVSAPFQYDGTPSAQKALNYIETALKNGSVVFEWKHQRPNGELWDAEVHLISFQSGEKKLLQFSMIDITERKKMETLLRNSEEKYKTLIETSQDGISLMDLSGHFIFVNNRMIEMLRIKSEIALIDESIINILTENYRSLLAEIIPLLTTKGQFTNIEAEVMRSDGTSFAAEFNLSVLQASDGTPLQIMATMRDITRRKAQQESELKYQNLFENAQLGIYQTSPQGKIIKANPALIKMLGFDSLEEIQKRDLEEDNVYAASTRNCFKEIMNNHGVVKDFESSWKKKNGETIIVLENSRAEYSKSGEIIYYEGFVENITERKLAEKALQESQKTFETLAQMSPVGIFRTRADGYTTYVNPKWTELSGLPFEEALGDGWLKAVHPEDRVLLAENWKMHSSKGEKSMTEYRFVKPDGSTVWVLGDTNPEIVDDEIKGYIGTLTNITELKLAENAIKESEERFKTLSTIASEGIMIHEGGIIIDLNQTFANILGYSNEKDLIGKIGLETIPFTQESKQIVRSHFLSKSEETLDIEIVNLKGAIIPIETRGVEIVYKGRKANLVYIRDITERKQAEKALIESEERHRKLIEALPEMIMQTDLNGKILYGNEPLEQITGITQKDYNNPNRLAHIHPEDQKKVKDALMDFLNSNTIHSDVIENRFIDTWGNLHWFSGRWTKLNLNDQLVIQTVTRDITENKKNELELNNYRNHLELLVQERTDELATTNEELRSTNEELFDQREELQNSIDKLHEAQQQLIHAEKMASLGVLSAGIAHEINNPLNFIHGGIVGLEDYINDNIPEHSLKVEPLLNAVNIGVKRATAIVTSLSHYSRKEDLPPTDCDIHEIIDNSLIMLQNKLKNKVEIKKHYTSDNCVIFGSEGKLHQAFLNIISNAEQAITSKGTIEINTKIKQKNLIISITDSGSGINPENIQKIFDPFFTTKDPGKGTGLGMAITYNIIKEHQGTIAYDSNVGLGTTVIITLPITKKIKN